MILKKLQNSDNSNNKYNKAKKILFVGQSTNHFSYYNVLVIKFLNIGWMVEYHYDSHFESGDLIRLKQLSEKFDNFYFRAIDTSKTIYIKWFFRELLTYNWYSTRLDQSKFFRDRWINYFPKCQTGK